MAGANVELDFNFTAAATSPVPLASKWTKVILKPGEISMDNGLRVADTDLTQPSTFKDSRLRIQRNSRANILRLRMAYSDEITAIQVGPPSGQPLVRVYGRIGTSDDWQLLENLAGNLNAELTAYPSLDLKDSTYKYTQPDRDQNAWDCEGYEEMVVGVERAYTPASGQPTDNDVHLQARMTT